jgi:hypothetical protein
MKLRIIKKDCLLTPLRFLVSFGVTGQISVEER